jgi:hypothetical protein
VPRQGAAVSDDEARPATAVTVVTGERYEVEGSPKDVEKAIVDASRGSIMQLAWVTEAGSGRSIGINPQHVVALEPA